MTADFTLPDDVALFEFARAFDTVDGLAAYLASDENDLYGTVAFLHHFARTQRALKLKDAYFYAGKLMNEGVIRSGGWLEAVNLVGDAVTACHALLNAPADALPDFDALPPLEARKADDAPAVGNLGWLGGNDGMSGYDDDCYYGEIGWRG